MSLRKAIDIKCKDCIYHRHDAGTWRKQVALCESKSCPLWPVRTKGATHPLRGPVSPEFSAESESKTMIATSDRAEQR